MSDDTPKIFVDDDWKEEARREKEQHAEQAAEAEAAGEIPDGAAFPDLVNLIAMQAMVGLGLIQAPGQPETDGRLKASGQTTRPSGGLHCCERGGNRPFHTGVDAACAGRDGTPQPGRRDRGGLRSAVDGEFEGQEKARERLFAVEIGGVWMIRTSHGSVETPPPGVI